MHIACPFKDRFERHFNELFDRNTCILIPLHSFIIANFVLVIVKHEGVVCLMGTCLLEIYCTC